MEDDADLLEVVVGQLEGLGYRMLAARNGEEALALYEQHGGVDLLLTDVILAGNMNGRDIAGELKKRDPDIRVLYMSGHTENAIVHAGRLGVDTKLLKKPFSRGEPGSMLQEILYG